MQEHSNVGAASSEHRFHRVSQEVIDTAEKSAMGSLSPLVRMQLLAQTEQPARQRFIFAVQTCIALAKSIAEDDAYRLLVQDLQIKFFSVSEPFLPASKELLASAARGKDLDEWGLDASLVQSRIKWLIDHEPHPAVLAS